MTSGFWTVYLYQAPGSPTTVNAGTLNTYTDSSGTFSGGSANLPSAQAQADRIVFIRVALPAAAVVQMGIFDGDP